MHIGQTRSCNRCRTALANRREKLRKTIHPIQLSVPVRRFYYAVAIEEERIARGKIDMKRLVRTVADHTYGKSCGLDRCHLPLPHDERRAVTGIAHFDQAVSVGVSADQRS